jgi:hypothetical protein
VLTRDPRLRAQRLCHYLNHSVPGLFRPIPARARRARWRFSDPPDDKTVRKPHFCSSRYPSTGPLCGSLRKFVLAAGRIAVLGAQSAPKRRCRPAEGSAAISRAEPLAGRTKLLSAELVGAIQTGQGLRAPWTVMRGHSEYEIPQNEPHSGPAARGSRPSTPGSGEVTDGVWGSHRRSRQKAPTKSAESTDEVGRSTSASVA